MHVYIYVHTSVQLNMGIYIYIYICMCVCVYSLEYTFRRVIGNVNMNQKAFCKCLYSSAALSIRLYFWNGPCRKMPLSWFLQK